MKRVILGPTASGKSALAVEVARRLGGVVVNGDPFQSLTGVPVGTGQPSTEEQGGIPHLGYGVQPLSSTLNPVDFGSLVRQWLLQSEMSILVTGSGLYLRGIWNQMDSLPDVPPSLVDRVRTLHQRLGAPIMHRYLHSVDPIRASELHPNDGARIQRALALHFATGLRPSSLRTGVSRTLPEGWKAVLVMPSRDRLRERVAARVQAMVMQGWPEEVRILTDAGHGKDLRRLRPLGYVAWMDGGTVEEIQARVVQETQAYAKRQCTWFRNQLPEVPQWDPDQESLDRAMELLG